jgi:hypothetical protein
MEFQRKLIEYLEQLIKLDFDWAVEPDEIDVNGQEPGDHPGYRFPTYGREGNCTLEEWMKDFEFDAKSIAIATQTHHHTSTCRKKGTACRFHFSGDGKKLNPETKIDLEKAIIELKRGHPMVNNHNPLISAVNRANHDLTAIFTSCLKRLQSMYYMTTYVSKCEDDTSDLIAMKEAFRTLERDKILPCADEQEQVRRLIIRINYLRQNSTQFSGAQTAAMLLKIGNDGTHYTNTTFSRINLYKFMQYISQENSDFKVPLSHQNIQVESGTSDSDRDCECEDSNECNDYEDNEEEGNLGINFDFILHG